jgi:5'-3' exonuclease
VLVSVLR